MNEIAALVAWVGAALIVLSDGRRGLALGLGLIAAAYGVLAWQAAGWVAATAVVIGGAAAATLRLRAGQPGWGVMPPGSTPRLILSAVGGILAVWVAASVATGSGGPLRFATLVVVGMMGVRVLTTASPPVVLTAIAAIALATAEASAIAQAQPGPAPFVAAALIAVGVSTMRVTEPRVA